MFASVMLNLYFEKGNSDCKFCISVLAKTNRHLFQNMSELF